MKNYKFLPTNLYKQELQTPIGKLWALASCSKLFAISFDDDFSNLDAKHSSTELLQELQVQFQNYFSHKQKQFHLPTELIATKFQKNIFSYLQKIKYGETISYKGLAEKAGKSAKYARAVGLAMNANPLPVILPCHRVIGSNGKLVGFGGGLQIKEYLLRLEQKTCL